MKNFLLGIAAISVLAVSFGCGGSGSPATGSGGRVTTYFTDDMGTNDHVWVKVFKVDLLTSAGGVVNVFDDSVGREIDLRTLRDGTGGRFAFVGAEFAEAGTYGGARVIMDRNLTIFPSGATVGLARSFAPAFLVPGQGNRARADLDFAAPLVITTGASDVVIDFDLSSWDDDGSLISPVLRPGSSTGLDDEARHERHSFHGVVSALTGTAPDQSFTLTIRTGFQFTVLTDARTAIYRSDGSGNPSLANGQAVEVSGTYSRSADAFKAREVRIRPLGDPRGGAEIHGEPSNIGANQFDVTVRRARGFIPPNTVIHVQFGGTTRFFSNGGVPMDQATFLAALATSSGVEAEGTFIPLTRTLVATKLKLDDEGGEHEAEAKGTPSAINAPNGTFKVTLTEWQGFSGSVGMLIDVDTHPGTTYKDNSGNVIDAAAFFAALGTSARVEVEGVLDPAGNLIHARKAKLDDH